MPGKKGSKAKCNICKKDIEFTSGDPKELIAHMLRCNRTGATQKFDPNCASRIKIVRCSKAPGKGANAKKPTLEVYSKFSNVVPIKGTVCVKGSKEDNKTVSTNNILNMNCHDYIYNSNKSHKYSIEKKKPPVKTCKKIIKPCSLSKTSCGPTKIKNICPARKPSCCSIKRNIIRPVIKTSCSSTKRIIFSPVRKTSCSSIKRNNIYTERKTSSCSTKRNYFSPVRKSSCCSTKGNKVCPAKRITPTRSRIKICPARKTSCPGIKDRRPSRKNICPAMKARKGTCPGVIDFCPLIRDICSARKISCTFSNNSCPTSNESCPYKKNTCPAMRKICPVKKKSCSMRWDSCPLRKRSSCPIMKDSCTRMKDSCPRMKDSCPAMSQTDRIICPRIKIKKCSHTQTQKVNKCRPDCPRYRDNQSCPRVTRSTCNKPVNFGNQCNRRPERCISCNFKKHGGTREMYKTSFETWSAGCSSIYCPKCNKKVRPLIRKQKNKVAFTSLGASLLLTCWPFCFLFPSMYKYSVDLYCPCCKNKLGVYNTSTCKMMCK